MLAEGASHSSPPDPRLPPLWEAGVIGCALLALSGGLLWWTFAAPGMRAGASAAFVGDAACRDCHPGEWASHQRSGHSKTLRRAEDAPIARSLDNVEVADPEVPGATWKFVFRGGRLATERRTDSATERFVIDYALGSGRHATTFVTLTDRTSEHLSMIEHRLTAFAHLERPDVTPGQSLSGTAAGNTPSGRRYSSWNTRKCFECHATTLSDRDDQTFDEATMIPNVTCERCHGSGRDHVRAARAGAPANALALRLGPGRASAEEQLQVCGQCHRLPEMISGGRAAITPDNPVIVRHQPVGLMQSACYTKSRGALSCSTCHNPHARASKGEAAYESTCRSCHEGAMKTPCKTLATTGCVSCHMPRRDVARGMIMTDHWIRVVAPPTAASKPTRK